MTVRGQMKALHGGVSFTIPQILTYHFYVELRCVRCRCHIADLVRCRCHIALHDDLVQSRCHIADIVRSRCQLADVASGDLIVKEE